RRSIGQGAEIAGAHDGRVVERRDRACLLVEPPRLLCATRTLGLLRRAQALQCDALSVHRVLAEIHDPHPPAPKLADDLVAPREHRADLAVRRLGFAALLLFSHPENRGGLYQPALRRASWLRLRPSRPSSANICGPTMLRRTPSET